ncbi:MAG: hypothetical protein ACI9YT_000810 [Halobacteriales archaeon]|jgi:hypothetical protein
MVERSPTASRRNVVAAGTAALAALAGCSALQIDEERTTQAPPETPLDRIVVRSDTGREEPLRLTLVYGPPDGHTERPVWTTVDAPADGDPATVVQGLDTGPGVYSLTAASARHANHEVVSFNSPTQPGAGANQFAVVVREGGDVWATLDEAGQPISIPGEDG